MFETCEGNRSKSCKLWRDIVCEAILACDFVIVYLVLDVLVAVKPYFLIFSKFLCLPLFISLSPERVMGTKVLQDLIDISDEAF